jgi:hypothetical protein
MMRPLVGEVCPSDYTSNVVLPRTPALVTREPLPRRAVRKRDAHRFLQRGCSPRGFRLIKFGTCE